jgi:hypothetical protein
VGAVARIDVGGTVVGANIPAATTAAIVDHRPALDLRKAAFEIIVHRAVVHPAVNAGVGHRHHLASTGVAIGPGSGRAHDAGRHVVGHRIQGPVLDPEHLGPVGNLIHAPLGQEEGELLPGDLPGGGVQICQPRRDGTQVGALKENDAVDGLGPVQVGTELVGGLVQAHPAHGVKGRHPLLRGAIHPHQEGKVGQIVHHPPAQHSNLVGPCLFDRPLELDDVGALPDPRVGIRVQRRSHPGLGLQRIEGGIFQPEHHTLACFLRLRPSSGHRPDGTGGQNHHDEQGKPDSHASGLHTWLFLSTRDRPSESPHGYVPGYRHRWRL